MKHIQKFNEEFFSGSDAMGEFQTPETEAYSALEELRSNLDLAIDLLDKQIATKEAHPNVLQDVVEKTEEYNRFIKSIIGPQ
jgi:hypothetical protein